MKKSFALNLSDNIYGAIIKGMLLGAVISAVCICVCAFLLTVKDFDESFSRPLALVCATVGSFVSGYAAAKTFKKNGLPVGAITGFLLFLAFSIIAVIITKSGLSALFFVRMLFMISASSVGGIIGVNRVQKRKIV